MENKLTHAEMLVMGIIWDAPKHLVLSEIVETVNERWGKNWKPQTVSTYLAHLVRKGYLKMHRNGRAYTYEPLKAKDEYMASILGALYDWYSPELKETDFVLNIAKPETRMNHLEINCGDEKALFLIEASRLYDEGLRIEALVTDTNVGDKWIPCSERLPEEKVNPITRCYYSYPVLVDFGDGVIDIRFYHFGRRHWLHVGLEMDKYVTYWMDIYSLSTPYKGEQE